MPNLNSFLLKIRDSRKSWRVQQFLHSINISIRPSNATLDGQLLFLLEKFEIEDCIDVGAHVGSFVNKLLRLGFKGRFLCFEPAINANNILKERFKNKKNIEILGIALGREKSIGKLHNAGTPFASILETNDLGGLYVENNPENSQEITVLPLDEILDARNPNNLAKTFLKIDVQGFELEVLNGAMFSLSAIPIVMVECVLNSLYDDSSNLHEIVEFMSKKNYRVASIHSDYWFDGYAPDCDVIFTKKPA